MTIFDDSIAETDEFYSGDLYDTIPFGDAIRWEEEQVARDLDAGEGHEYEDLEQEAEFEITARKDRLAALIFFKEEVSEEQAQSALESIGALLEPPMQYGEEFEGPGGRKMYRLLETPITLPIGDLVQSYNPGHGSPVWYIP